MIFRLLYISFAFVLLLSTSINASRYRSLRPKRDVCPDASVDICPFIICENGAQCQQDLNTADCYKCMCPAGFTGKVCETPIAILPVGCSPGCQNGGVCSGNICVCQAGYSGSLCEVRNYCLPTNPCQNSGRCISNTISYQCDCTGTGYTGTICTDIITTDPCSPSPCENGGQCSSNNGLATCLCINGYFGAYCQIAPVPCAATPCENGGQCELLATNAYGCVCPADFTGIRCETYILTTHPCVTMPDSLCLNGGTCIVNDADYLCKCAPGWNGRNCQTQAVISSCNPNPCVHGSCTEVTVASEPVAYCTCDNQWTGKLCDIDMNGVCTAEYCLSGGTCLTNGNIPYCQCPALYTGPRCESYIGAITTTTTAIPGTTCFPNPCLNGGGCYINNNVVGCLCSSAWTGQTCEIPVGVVTTTTLSPGVSACASNPCMNGGSCFNNGNGFVCGCLPAWSGLTCTISTGFLTTTTLSPGVSACASNPCMNGGSCFNNGNSFVCACLPAWTGARCEYSQSIMVTTASVFNPCTTSQPCRNGGSCYTLNDSYYCQCTNAYTGTNCEAIIVASCPLNCAPGVCTISGSSTTPYVCMCNGTLKLTSCN